MSTGRGLHRAGLLFALTDPAGDDHGEGAVLYPLCDDIAPGELDFAVRCSADAVNPTD